MPATVFAALPAAEPYGRYREALRAAPDLVLCGHAHDTPSTLEALAAAPPDFLVLWGDLPGSGGHAVLRRAQAEGWPTRIVAVTHGGAEERVALLEAGYEACLAPEAAPEHLLRVLRAALRGETLVRRDVLCRLLARRSASGGDGHLALTPRQRHLLRLLAQGHSSHHIADALHLAPGTVRNALTRLYEHLGVRNRVEAVQWAWQHGYTDAF